MAETSKPTAKKEDIGADIISQLQKEIAEKEILLSLNNDIATVRDRKDILKIIHPKLKTLFNTDDIFICLIDNVKQTLNPFLRVAGGSRINSDGYDKVMNSNFPLKDLFIDRIIRSNEPLVTDLSEIFNLKNSPGYIKTSKRYGLAESLSMSLYHGGKMIGILTFWAENKNTFTQHHIDLIQRIADHVSIVIMNILANEELQQREKEKDILLNISKEFTSVRKRAELLPLLKKQFEHFSFYSDVVIAKVDDNNETFSAFVVNEEETSRVGDTDYPEVRDAHQPFPDGVFEVALNADKPVIFDVQSLATQPHPLPYIKFIYDNGTVDMIGISLRDGYKRIGVLFLFSPKKISFFELQLNLAQGIGNQLGTVVSNILANEKMKAQLEEINKYKEQLEEENIYLHQQVRRDESYSEIIGGSEQMEKVFLAISQVAFADSTVLLLGETGTGKELVARAIHNSSPRRDRFMVKVNCAVIPPNLIESELFGHEKGSFTGATEKRIGKFELANNGTLFLDEVGEMPLDLQVKLLRAIQEKEIERIGGRTTIKVNVRIIAATNRDLQREVDEGKFRQDLFYRLNVFPITLPALRERKDDIPLLVSYFLEKFSKITGKKITGISSKAMKKLLAYDWPGNVRELEHLFERTVLMSGGNTIKDVHLNSNARVRGKKDEGEEILKTHEENEREHIIKVLNKCNGKIFGPGGAASILNLQVSTLNSKIKKLGIKKNRLYS
jgi:formate hydrogenlyase transcriptional activator